MSRVGIVTGMVAESGCLADTIGTAAPQARPLLYCAAANAQRAHDGALDLVRQGATALVSFGIAGGLSPSLAPGSLILAESVQTVAGHQWRTAIAWRQSLDREIGADADGVILASETAVRSAMEKNRLHVETGAVAVDMESGGVARAAETAGVPFLIVRVIADPATRRLPPSALAGLGQDGRRRPFAVVAALARRPWDIAELVRLGRDSSAALQRLRGVASRGPSLFRAPGA